MRKIRMVATMGAEVIDEIEEFVDYESDSTIQACAEDWARYLVSVYWEEIEDEEEDEM